MMAPMPELTDKDRERFEKFIYADPMSGCWLWGGSLDEWGYGKFTKWGNGRQRWIGAHRVSWTMNQGEIPGGLFVLHRCDTPACVNPDHLWLGSHQDNQFDKARKGRGRSYPRTLTRGVTRSGRKFRARMRIKGKHLSFGTYDTQERAAEAAEKGRRDYFGRVFS